MTKKILLGLFILLMGAVSIVAYNFYKNVKQPINKTAFEAIPMNAVLIVKENNFNALYQKIATTNMMWEELVANTAIVNDLDDQIHYLDSLLSGPFRPLFVDQTLLGSLHLSGANDFNFVFYIPFSDDVSESKLIQKIKNTTGKMTDSREYDGVLIHSFPTNGAKNLSLIAYKNTLAFSFSTVLIEDVVRQLNSENSLLQQAQFAKMINTSGLSEDGNLFINCKNFSKFLYQYLTPSAKAYCASLENYTGWTEFDLNIKSNTLSLNGFSFSNAKDNHFLAILKEQKPQRVDMLSIIPYNAAFVFHYGLSNPKHFFDERKRALKNTNQFFNYQQFLDQQIEQHGIDLEAELMANIGKEVALVITESLTGDFKDNKFVIFHSEQIEKTASDLAGIATKTNPEPFELSSFNDFPINRITLNNMFRQLLGKPFVNMEEHHYTIIDDYVVFGNSENALKKFITNFKQEKVLSNNENFKAFQEDMSTKSNIFIYNNMARSISLYKTYCKKKYISIVDEKLEVFRKFEAASFQVSVEKNGLYYNTINLKYNPVFKQETASLWELSLDAIVSSTPQIVLNHKSRAKEIFVQDDAHKIYLISNTGKIIWTKQLQEKILGKVHQIDVYKNNKLQLLFNTPSKIYLLDRNGENVEKYPVKLLAKATNGVTPLDYANNRDYRLLIGCENRMVYNYDVKGDLVKGWEYVTGDSPAKGNVWHFANAGKDYIVIPLISGAVKIIQRNGKDRVMLNNQLPVTNVPYHLKRGNNLSTTYLIASDSMGNLSKLYLTDKLEKIQLEEPIKNGSFNYFDLNGNHSKDFVFCWEKKLKIMDSDRNLIFETEFENNITELPQLYQMSDKSIRIGIVAEGQIYLMNSEGVLDEGFPLAGSTRFSFADINNDKTMNLVVAHGNMLYTYNLK